MATARCTDCDAEWELEAPDEPPRERPRCPECGGGRVDVEDEDGWFVVWR